MGGLVHFITFAALWLYSAVSSMVAAALLKVRSSHTLPTPVELRWSFLSCDIIAHLCGLRPACLLISHSAHPQWGRAEWLIRRHAVDSSML